MYHQRHRKLNGHTAALIITMMLNSVDAMELKNMLLSREIFERPHTQTHPHTRTHTHTHTHTHTPTHTKSP